MHPSQGFDYRTESSQFKPIQQAIHCQCRSVIPSTKMSRPVLLICTILSFFHLVQNVCIEPPMELARRENLTAIACVKSENYTNDVSKITKPNDKNMILVFSMSDIPILVNHGFTPLASVLTHLMISKSGLETIEDDAFAGLTKVQRLNLGNNQLTEVKGTWFKNMPSLESIELDRNRIAQFDPAVFTHLPKLQELDISRNRLHCFDVEHLKTLNATRVFLDRNPYDWICAVPILKWSKENEKDLLFYESVGNIANECWDKITEGPEKPKMLDDCISAKLDEALQNSELLLNQTDAKLM